MSEVGEQKLIPDKKPQPCDSLISWDMQCHLVVWGPHHLGQPWNVTPLPGQFALTLLLYYTCQGASDSHSVLVFTDVSPTTSFRRSTPRMICYNPLIPIR